MEIRKDIPGYEIYQISNMGRCIAKARTVEYMSKGKTIIRYKKKMLMKPLPDAEGYTRYFLYTIGNSTPRPFRISRLVGQAFLGLDIEDLQTLVCHKDDNPANNVIDNLFLGTQKDNQQDCINKGRKKVFLGQNNGASRLKDCEVSEIKKLLAIGCSHTAIGIEYGVSRPTITKISLGLRRTHIE